MTTGSKAQKAFRACTKKLVYCITDISPNNLYKFSSAALSSIDVATATPHSSALHMKKSSGGNPGIK